MKICYKESLVEIDKYYQRNIIKDRLIIFIKNNLQKINYFLVTFVNRVKMLIIIILFMNIQIRYNFKLLIRLIFLMILMNIMY